MTKSVGAITWKGYEEVTAPTWKYYIEEAAVSKSRHEPTMQERGEFMAEINNERAAQRTERFMMLIHKYLGEFYSPELEAEIQAELEKWL